MRRKPYRVIVWGPGGVGRACLRQLIDRKDCEIVGVLAYSAAKNGKDVGDLIGHAPIGVRVTTNKEDIFGLAADAVLYSGMLPFDVPSMESDIIRLLESGKNVISAVAFHFAHNHGAAYVEKFEDACRKGNSCLHGTGENPGFWFERVAMTLTGVCTHVEYLQLDEYADLSTSGSTPELLAAISFGETAETAAKPGPMDALWKEYYFVEILNMASISLFGRPLDRVEHKPQHYVAERDVELSRANGDPIDMRIPRGRVYAMSHVFTGFLEERKRLGIGVNWFLRRRNSPFQIQSEHTWRINLEGKPVSLRCDIGAYASLTDDSEFHAGDPTTSTYYITAVNLIQAIPILCAHQPGIVYASVFATSSEDLRNLEGRTRLGE
jgi:hypothetical protein